MADNSKKINIGLNESDKKDIADAIQKAMWKDKKAIEGIFKTAIKQNENNWRSKELRKMFQEELTNSPAFKEYEESIAGKFQKLTDMMFIGRSIENRNRRTMERMQKMTEGQFKHYKAMQDALPKSLGQALGGAKNAIGGTFGNIKNSKVGNSAFNTLMQSNPLTALLYQNADLFKGLGNLAFKNPLMKFAGHGLGFLAESAAAKIGLTSKGSALWKVNPATGASQAEQQAQNNAEKMLALRQDAEVATVNGGQSVLSAQNVAIQGGQQQIIAQNVIIQGGQQMMAQAGGAGMGAGPIPGQLALPGARQPRLVSKENKFQKGVNGMLTKVTGSMKTITDIMKVLKLKQTLIVVGILALVAGIAGLAAYLKNKVGGEDGTNANRRRGAVNKTNNIIDQGNTANLNASGVISMINQTTSKDTRTAQTGSTDFKNGKAIDMKKFNEMKSAGQISQTTSDLILGGGIGNVNWTKKDYQTNDQKPMKLAFPVALKLKKFEPSKVAGEGGTILIEKAEVTRGTKERLNYAGGTMPQLIITNVIKILIPLDYVVKANTLIGLVGANYQIIGDTAAFMRGDTKYQDYANQQQANSTTIDNNYIEARKDAKFDKKLLESEKKWETSAAIGEAVAQNPATQAVDTVTDVKNLMTGTPSTNEVKTNSTSNQINNQNKQNTQNKKSQANEGSSGTPVNVKAQGSGNDIVAYETQSPAAKLAREQQTPISAALT